MLRVLYYLCKKSGKISAKNGGGLILHHGRILRIVRYATVVSKIAPYTRRAHIAPDVARSAPPIVKATRGAKL